MFQKILIANRGEIACRIIRTCRRLGIQTVAVYSEADLGSRHVVEADFAVPIGDASATESYLRADRIVAAALTTGAQAIHPGYGFLSEKLELLDVCEHHGICFVGPNRYAIEAMGSKIESKRIARAAGLVCVPGYDGDEQAPERLLDAACHIGFPLLIKASAGGGGKGMRRVNAQADFLAMLGLARKEALSAFGDERVLLEKFIVNPRHVEVQIVGDRHGGLVHLFERECSLQRRFQKVIEEAPAPHMPDVVAAMLYESALRMGKAMAYDNAGTVEFVLDADDSEAPYFLEVNTRLQVEHPVTEMTTGIDLVEWQLRVAAGETLPLQQNEIHRSGWAIECRINAEEPEHDYRASLGGLIGYAEPTRLAGVRIDSGLHAASQVTPYYDAMLAKVIGYGATRAEAKANACAGIESLRIEGLRTNAALLLQVLRHADFDALLTTRFLEQHFPNGPQKEPMVQHCHSLAVASAWAASQAVGSGAWGSLRGFRLTGAMGLGTLINLRLTDVSAAFGSEALGLLMAGDHYYLPSEPELFARVQPRSHGWRVQITGPVGLDVTFHIRHAEGQAWFSWAQGRSMLWEVEHELEHSLHVSSEATQDQNLSATLPGRIAEVMVSEGQLVAAGEPVLIMEAMKLYHTLAAPLTGRIGRVHVGQDDIVAHGQLLLEMESEAGTLVMKAMKEN